MVKLLILFLIFQYNIFCQKPTISNIQLYSDSETAIVVWESATGSSTLNGIEYGTTTNLGSRTIITTTGTTQAKRSLNIGSLTPNTRYYFIPISSENDVITGTANSGDETITYNSHSLSNNDSIRFSASAPGGTNTSDVYYVTNVTENTFQLKLNRDSESVIDLTSSTSPSFRRINSTYVCTASENIQDGVCVNEQIPYFDTTESSSPYPIEPTLPSNIETPTINGETFTVTVDENGFCTNFQTLINSAAAENDTLNHEIIIPSGAICRGKFHIPAKANNGGTVIVRSSDVGTNKFPDEGVRITPDFEPFMATIELPANADSSGATTESYWSVLTSGPSTSVSSSGWRFIGIKFTIQDFSEFDRVDLNISDISEDGVITTSETHPFKSVFDQVCIADVQGMENINGCWGVTTPITSTTFKLSGYTPSGTYASGGYVINAPHTNMSSCSGTPTVCTTVTRHGISNFLWNTISDVTSGGTVTFTNISNGFYSTVNAVEISGSSNSELNGIWKTGGISGSTVVLQSRADGQSVSSMLCSSNCGTIRPKQTITIENTNNDEFNNSHIYTVLSSTTIQLDLKSGSSLNGFLTRDPERIVGPLVLVDRGSRASVFNSNSRWGFDRCIFDGKGFPYRVNSALGLNGHDIVVINNYFHNFTSWRPVNPVSNRVEYGVAGSSPASVILLSVTEGSRKYIKNNYFQDCHGICVFAEEGRSNSALKDLIFENNHIFTSRNYIAGFNGQDITNGKYFYNRHHFELKHGERVKIVGNIFDGNYADAVPQSPTVMLSVRGTVSGFCITDVLISNNLFKNHVTPVQIEGIDNIPGNVRGTTHDCFKSTQKILFENNISYNQNLRLFNSNPSTLGVAAASTGLTGHFFVIHWPTQNIIIRNNTLFDNKGSTTRFISGGNGVTNLKEVSNNIISYNNEGNYGHLIVYDLYGWSSRPIPNNTTNMSTVTWNQINPNINWINNIIIPGVTNTNLNVLDSTYYSPFNNQFTTATCETYYTGMDSVCVPGNNVQERIDSLKFFSVYYDNSVDNHDLRLKRNSIAKNATSTKRDAGVNFIEFNRTQKRLYNIRKIGTTVYYNVNGYESCYVDHSSSPFPDVNVTPTRVYDSGSGIVRSVANITGSYYSVNCKIL